ncbi:MAG TPA: hypothetical protein VNT76_05720 [Candidatus Binatus sp.]|nr:hypothetical protein [Candidatus Binatus sp.]
MTKNYLSLSGYRRISQFHENQRLSAWVQKQPVVIWLTPNRRRFFLVIGALLVGGKSVWSRYLKWVGGPAGTLLIPILTFAILLGLVYLVYLAAARFQKLPGWFKRRPQIWLHVAFWAFFALLWAIPDDAGEFRKALVLLAISLPILLWRCGYMLMSGQRGKTQRTKFYDHLFYLWPAWGGTNTPIGKGHDYLSQCEAKTPEAYARSVLAATKLIILALLLQLFDQISGAILYGESDNAVNRTFAGLNLGIPHLSELVSGQTTAAPPVRWFALYMELFWETLRHATLGHRWVSLLRLFGFNVFRNTYKPLLAQSLVDFWNRYYYYFKELLVEFFFFPIYLRHFKNSPKLRMFAAVFAAAFVGNMYYHFLEGRISFAKGEFLQIVQALSPRMIYCAMLTLGIYFSMLRQNQRRGKAQQQYAASSKLVILRRIAGVWTFFALINLWNTRIAGSVGERIAFTFSLFGL